MRLALLADVHGNRRALEAVLGRVEDVGADRVVCAGDVVGWGPEPDACVELLADAAATVVAGNHDLIVLDRLGDERCSELARRSQAWTRSVLRDDTREWLGALPTTVRLGPVVVTHGSLDDPQQYVRSADDAAAQLDQLRRDHPGASVLVLGHTHQPMVVGARTGVRARRTPADLGLPDDLHLVNPGSVGQSRSWERPPLARFAVLDLAARRVRLEQVAYDWRAARADARRAGLPPEAVHAPPRSPTRLARRVARRLRDHPGRRTDVAPLDRGRT